MMKKLLLASVLAGLAGAAFSGGESLQVGGGPLRKPSRPHTFVPAAELAARIAANDAAVAAGRPVDGEPLLFQDGHRVTLEWRNVPQKGINVHLRDAEMFVVVEGRGVMTLGGTLVDPVPQPDNPYEHATLSAKAVTGAHDYPVAKGDMIMIPAGTPHTGSKVDGKLVLWSMILPNAPGGAWEDKALAGTPSLDAPPPGLHLVHDDM